MSFNNLIQYIFSQKDVLDKIIAESSINHFDRNHHSYPNIVFDIDETINECFSLSQNRDLCYDRPSIGFTYSLWYQGRRINTFLKYFAKIIYDARDEKSITLFDLGAGTGAVQLAVGMVYVAMKKTGVKTPQIKIINIDTSPFMLDYNRSYLWPIFINSYPEAGDILLEYALNSWSATSHDKYNNCWFTASYLFDHSENKDDLMLNFLELVESFAPSKILLLSSLNKKSLTVELAEMLRENNYNSVELESDLIFTGLMNRVNQARKLFNENLETSFRGNATWNDNALYGCVLSTTNPIFDLFAGENINEINIYNPPIKVRREIELNPLQKIAANPDGRPTIITGPAGCGKSVVITDRIISLVEEANSRNKIHEVNVLVTTFNKELRSYLSSWLKDMLSYKNINYTVLDNGLGFENSQKENITIMHFDILPTRIWKSLSLKDYPFDFDTLSFDNYHKSRARIAIEIIKKEENITRKDYDNILNDEYVLDEYHRIIYGNGYTSEQIYLTSRRQGRPVLQYNGTRRKLLFKTIIKYLSLLETEGYSSIITRRNKFLKKLNTTPNMNGIFDHIFVDEFQDCTQSDYTIFYKLISNPNNLVIAGDFAQAVHIGSVADIPRDNDETSERMRNRRKHVLKGSYRLPYRISEAIYPISKFIRDNSNEQTDEITPYKGAPPGARPILVYAENDEQMASKIIQIIKAYNLFDVIDLHDDPVRNITILEKDKSLVDHLNQIEQRVAVTDTILRLKGMEKNCIVWSTKPNIPDEDEIFNYVYTIMTRTSGILIIALYDNCNPKFKEIINLIRKDRLIFWDLETKQIII
jgi:DNA helicase-2/ATP-dependent DNA helicase PcrA